MFPALIVVTDIVNIPVQLNNFRQKLKFKPFNFAIYTSFNFGHSLVFIHRASVIQCSAFIVTLKYGVSKLRVHYYYSYYYYQNRLFFQEANPFFFFFVILCVAVVVLNDNTILLTPVTTVNQMKLMLIENIIYINEINGIINIHLIY